MWRAASVRDDADGHLADIHERTRIEKHGDQAEYTEDDGATWEQLGEDSACIDEPLGLYFQHLKGVKGALCSIFGEKPVGKSTQM